MFLIVPLDQLDGLRCTMKCNPAYADELRTKYTETVYPGYHMNKKHWNTVYCNRALADEKIFELIDHSYELVSKGTSTVKDS